MSSITAVEAITVITVSARLNGSVVVGGIANQRAGIQAFSGLQTGPVSG